MEQILFKLRLVNYGLSTLSKLSSIIQGSDCLSERLQFQNISHFEWD